MNQPFERIQVGEMFLQMIQNGARHGLKLPGELFLLFRTLAEVEGLLRLFCLEFNVIAHCQAFAAEQQTEARQPARMVQAANNKLLISPVRDERGKLTHFMWVQMDVTKLRRAEQVRHEMEIAKQIQISLLPREPLQVEGALITGYCLPAAHVGGDYFDYFGVQDTVDIVIADVSGHSVRAALIMAETRAALRIGMRQLRGSALANSAAETLSALNYLLYEDLARAELFVTIVLYEIPCGKR